jgi:hypothetical protein
MELNIQEILNKNIVEYNFTTIEPMDNTWSMAYFLNEFYLFDRLTLDDGTYVEIDNLIGCHSENNGDFYSHKIKFEIL